MAKLTTQADRATIIACRGVIDFYYWKGIPVARRWPRKSSQPRTAREVASSEEFAAAAAITGGMGSAMVEAWKRDMVGVGVTWVDRQRAATRGKSWITYV